VDVVVMHVPQSNGHRSCSGFSAMLLLQRAAPWNNRLHSRGSILPLQVAVVVVMVSVRVVVVLLALVVVAVVLVPEVVVPVTVVLV
jgi:hypothetical protein